MEPHEPALLGGLRRLLGDRDEPLAQVPRPPPASPSRRRGRSTSRSSSRISTPAVAPLARLEAGHGALARSRVVAHVAGDGLDSSPWPSPSAAATTDLSVAAVSLTASIEPPGSASEIAIGEEGRALQARPLRGNRYNRRTSKSSVSLLGPAEDRQRRPGLVGRLYPRAAAEAARRAELGEPLRAAGSSAGRSRSRGWRRDVERGPERGDDREQLDLAEGSLGLSETTGWVAAPAGGSPGRRTPPPRRARRGRDRRPRGSCASGGGSAARCTPRSSTRSRSRPPGWTPSGAGWSGARGARDRPHRPEERRGQLDSIRFPKPVDDQRPVGLVRLEQDARSRLPERLHRPPRRRAAPDRGGAKPPPRATGSLRSADRQVEVLGQVDEELAARGATGRSRRSSRAWSRRSRPGTARAG